MLRVAVSACAVLVAVLLVVSSGEAGAARELAAPPAELCQLVSPVDTNASQNNSLDATSAQDTLNALKKAAKQSLPRNVKAAVKKLIPLYAGLASGQGSKALDTVQSYAAKHCAGGNGGGTTSSGNPGEGIDACALVSLDDAQALAGTALNPGVAGNPTSPSCTYTGPTTGPTAQVEVYVGDGAKKTLDIDRSLGHTLTPITGLGDEAYAEDNNIFIRHAKVWVAIRLVRLNNAADNAQPLEKLAARSQTSSDPRRLVRNSERAAYSCASGTHKRAPLHRRGTAPPRLRAPPPYLSRFQ